MIRTIEIDDVCIPKGWEPVEFRIPKIGEFFLTRSCLLVRQVSPEDEGILRSPHFIMKECSEQITAIHRGQLVLVANEADGPYVQRMLVDVSYAHRDYPYICEAIDHRLPHQCWRFAKRVGK